MTPKQLIEQLPILVIHPCSSCNCRCVMCDAWSVRPIQEIGASDLEPCIRDVQELGVRWVVLSGGEPLLYSDLRGLVSMLRESKVRITILSNGLLLNRTAPLITHSVDDLIISLDGPRLIHDRIRGVRGAFDLLSEGIRKIREIRPDFPISARCTVQRENHLKLREIVKTAKDLGLQSVSFLAVDLNSTAFGRSSRWSAERKAEVALTAEETDRLEIEVEHIINEDRLCQGFVLESPEKLRRIVLHFRSQLGELKQTAPNCNAPWVSTVIESDGAVRPCFFHEPIGNIKEKSLRQILNGSEALKFREQLDIAQDPICRHCVCSLNAERNRS